MTRFILCTIAAIASMAFLPSEADACSCAAPTRDPQIVAPLPDATEVPLNAKVWIGVGHTGDTPAFANKTITLREVSGAHVATTASVLAMRYAAVQVLSPAAELVASTTYEVLVDGESLAQFTTGTTRVETTPSRPSVISSTPSFYEPEGYDSCGPSYGESFKVQSDNVLTVMVQDTSEVDTTALSGGATQLLFSASNQIDAEYRSPMIGMSGCFTNWSGAGRGASTNVRFGTFDIAGHFSGFTDALDVKIPDPPKKNTNSDSGCHTAGAGALMLLGLLARRRSR